MLCNEFYNSIADFFKFIFEIAQMHDQSINMLILIFLRI